MKSIKEILIKRDGMSSKDAEELIILAKEEFNELLLTGDIDAAERICFNYFDLEPDYLEEFF